MAIFKGKTENEAIEKGLKDLGIDKEHADIKVISKPSDGIFGVFAKEAEVEIIVLSEKDLKIRRWKRLLYYIGGGIGALILITTFVLGAIFQESSKETPVTKISVPAGTAELVGKNYKSVINQLKGAGFTNIKEEKIEDLVTGLLTKDGEVEEVLIGSDNNFKEGEYFEKSEPIVVSYHTFEETTTTTTTSNVTTTTSTQTTVSSSSSTGQASNSQTIITPSNTPEFASLLTSDNPKAAASFVQTHKGQIVEFDGHVAYLNNSGSYKTRYDILIYGGDWIGENTTNYTGVNFQFYDVQTTSEAFSSLDGLSTGQNIHIKAVIDEYTDGELLRLEPLSVTAR